MKIPLPPLVRGICQLLDFPRAGTLSAPAPAAQGASPPSSSSVPSFLPNVILIISSSLVRAGSRAGSCVPLGRGMGPGLEVCRTWVSFAHGHPRDRGMRISGQGPSFPSFTPEPSWIFASFPEPLQLEINVFSAQLLSRVSLQLRGGRGTVPVSLCSSRGTALSAHHVPFHETLISYPQL